MASNRRATSGLFGDNSAMLAHNNMVREAVIAVDRAKLDLHLSGHAVTAGHLLGPTDRWSTQLIFTDVQRLSSRSVAPCTPRRTSPLHF